MYLSNNQQIDQQITDAGFMAHALSAAEQGAKIGEVPVGAVLVYDGKIVATGYNCPIANDDPSAHAEIVAIRAACAQFGNYRLPKGCTLYVTLEPCTMCIGLLVHSRLSRLVFGAREPKAGAVVSHAVLAGAQFNHAMATAGGVLAAECGAMLSVFFAQRRAQKRRAYKVRKQLANSMFWIAVRRHFGVNFYNNPLLDSYCG